MAVETLVETWKKRWKAARKLKEDWEQESRIVDCYNYWKGNQLKEPKDEFGNRRAQINKIHPEVRNSIPSLYYYRPFARLTAAPEYDNDAGTMIDDDTQLLQDTVNHLIRDRQTTFRQSTFLAMKEAHWAFGCVEVGYSAEFNDAPNAKKPPLKENKDTKTSAPKKEAPLTVGSLTAAPPNPFSSPPLLGGGGAPSAMPPMPGGASTPSPAPEPGTDQLGLSVDEGSDVESIQAEVERLKAQMKNERFFVKHIPAKQVIVSITDMPIIESNDWIGYYEDVPLEDVKRCKAYSNVKDLKAGTGDDLVKQNEENIRKQLDLMGETDKIRIYKFWDLRNKERWVLAEGGEKELLRKPYERLPLFLLRFDIDPYHFYPRPMILSKLDPQDEYNDSREYLRKIRRGTVPRYTYDQDGIDADQMRKLESGEMGTFVPRKGGIDGATLISPIQQPSYSENAIQTLTLSDKEFQDVGGVGGDARIAQSKTATQAKIGEVKEQAQDSFDRQIVAEWLGDICRELLSLGIEKMNLDQWVAVNVVPDSPFSQQLTQMVQQQFNRINATILSNAQAGVNWDVIVDIESLSPVSEEVQRQNWMQGLMLFANPVLARFFSVSPPMLKRTLDLMGVKSAKDQGLILQAMQAVVQMEQQLAAQSQNAQPGMSPQPGGGQPGAPKPGGPQPGGPGASVPKPPANTGA